MDEYLLQFIWKYQRYRSDHLITTEGQRLLVFHPGYHNTDSGPDFEEARIKIGVIEWNGSVEIHIASSDWDRHRHTNDPAYSNVILHVVWQDDKPLKFENETIPTLELKRLVDVKLLTDYQKHVGEPASIACASQFTKSLALPYFSMLDRVAVERLQQKADEVLQMLHLTNNSWDDVVYRLLVRSFGFSTNKTAFARLTEKLPYQVLKKNGANRSAIEALFFGQAGFLDREDDGYQVELAKEFKFLKQKYDLPQSLLRHEWKFGRMRPANFPSLRLAQISNLLFSRPRLFTQVVELGDIMEILKLLTFPLSDYWMEHYDFGKKRSLPKQSIGAKTIENIAINSLAPLLAAYSKYAQDQSFMDKAVSLLQLLSPEKNRVTKQWAAVNKHPKNAMESQAQIQLLKEYCLKRRCLSCAVGVTLLCK